MHSESSIVPRGDLAGRQEGHSLGHSAGDDEARPCNVTRRFRLIFPSSEVANPIDGAFNRCFCSFSLRLLSFLLCFIPPPAATASTLARFVSSTPRFFTFRCPSLSASSSSLGALGAQLCQILHGKSIFLVAYQFHPIPGSMMALTAHASCPARPSLFSSCPSHPLCHPTIKLPTPSHSPISSQTFYLVSTMLMIMIFCRKPAPRHCRSAPRSTPPSAPSFLLYCNP